MASIIKGSEISSYVLEGMSLGVSLNENRDGQKSKFVILKIRDQIGGLAKASNQILFEDEFGADKIEVLKNYRMMRDGELIKDSKGGYPIDLKALKASNDAEMFQSYFVLPGVMSETYNLKKGECYANDRNGNPIKDKWGENVTKTSIPILTQVKFFKVDNNGEMTPVYVAGMSLEERGQRMEKNFYRDSVNSEPEVEEDEVADDDF